MELLELSKIIYGNDIYNLINKSAAFLINNIPTFAEVENMHPIEIHSFLKLICSWLYEYKVDSVNRDWEIDSDIFNQLRDKLFNSDGLYNSSSYDSSKKHYKDLIIYKYILRLIIDPKLWAGNLFSTFKEFESATTLDKETKDECFRILQLFIDEKIISTKIFNQSYISFTKYGSKNLWFTKSIKESLNLTEDFFNEEITKEISTFELFEGDHKTDINIYPNSFRDIPDLKENKDYRIFVNGEKRDFKSSNEAISSYLNSKPDYND